MILEIDPIEPEPWLLARAVQVLRHGGIVVMPTDTVYGLTCGITHHENVSQDGLFQSSAWDPASVGFPCRSRIYIQELQEILLVGL